MSDEFKVQWSVSLPPAAQYAKGDMLNIRGATVEEVEALIDEALNGEFIQKASAVADLLRAAQVVTEGTKPAQGAPPAVQGAAQSAPQNTGGGQAQQTSYGRRKASAGTGGRGGKSDRLAPGVVPEPCIHGQRTFRDGNGARGYWSAYFCPTPKGTVDQCDPLWVDND